MHQVEKESAALARGLADCSLPLVKWTHKAHLTVAVYCAYQDHMHASDLLALMPDQIKRYNAAMGGENTDTSGYHETITRFYMRCVRAYVAKHAPRPCSEPPPRLAEIVNGFTSGRESVRDYPLRYYSEAHLMSVRARRQWVEPDKRPFDF